MGLVRLTAHLDAPIVLTDDLHLDGILAAAHPLCRERALSRDVPAEELIVPPLPIYRITHEGATITVASAAILPDGAHLGGSATVKRYDAEDIEARATALQVGLGPGKQRLIRHPIVTAPTVTWLAAGDRRQILRLCRRIGSLGSWRSAGYGAVARWEAVYVEDDGAAPLWVDGVAQRHLPAQWCAWAEAETAGALVPPYWHPARQRDRIVRAGTRCALHPFLLEQARAIAQPAALSAHRARRERRQAAEGAHAHPRLPAETGDQLPAAG